MRSIICVAGVVVAAIVYVQAANPPIGQAVSQGRMKVDNLPVTGSANLAEGSLLKTLEAPGRLFLQNGGRAALGPSSEAKILAGRIVLMSGSGTIAAAGGLRLEANGYGIQPDTGAQAHVEFQGTKIVVGAASGQVGVRDKEGALLARVMPGTPLTFEPTEGSKSSTVTGVLVRRGVRFFVKDEVTNVEAELEGKNLETMEALVGRRIRATGAVISTPGQNPQVIMAAEMDRIEEAPQSPPTNGGKAKSGMSRGTKIGIGVLAATAGGVGVSLGAISR